MRISFILPGQLAGEPDAGLAQWAAGAGFDAIDAEVEWADAGIAAIRDAGLALGPMRIRASLADSNADDRGEAIERARSGLDRASELGLDTVWLLPRNFRNDRTQRENFAAARESLPSVVAHAESLGIRIGIENCPFAGQNPVCTPESWDALFAAIPSPSIGICFDPSHCLWQGIDIRRAIREYGDRIYHLHAKDTEILADGLYRFGVEGPQVGDATIEHGWTKHGWWRHRLPGLGGVDWNGVVSGALDAGYDGMITVEHEDPVWSGSPDLIRRGLQRSLTYLQTMVP